jgi:hypothetical protein
MSPWQGGTGVPKLPRGDRVLRARRQCQYADCARVLGAATDGDSNAVSAGKLVEALRAPCPRI